MSYQIGPAEVPGGDRVFKVIADQDITQYAAVIQSPGVDNEIDMPTAAGAPAWGFAQGEVDYSDGQHHCRVRSMGFSKAIAYDDTITAGAYLQVADVLGRVVAAAGSDYVIARACQASTAANDIIVVQVLIGGFVI